MIIRPLSVFFLAATLVACASDPAPTEQMRLTDQALTQARALGVTSEHSERLSQAEAKYAQAQASSDNKQARLLAEQAELDARLAEAEYLSAKSQQQLTDLNHRISRLRQQLGAM